MRAFSTFNFWWGGVMVGAGAAFAMKGGWWPAWAALIFFGVLCAVVNRP